MNVTIEDLSKIFKSAKSAVVSAHQNPDGDAIGASFATALALEQRGVTPVILFDNYPEKYNFLAGRKYIYSGDYSEISADLFISLDCGSKDRLNDKTAEIFERTPITVNIDHHISNTYFAKNNYVFPEASSTCEVLYGILNQTSFITPDIASALYAGIVFDTSGFRHATTTSDTLSIVSRLLELNIPFSRIYRDIMCLHSFCSAKLLGRALTNMRYEKKGRLLYTSISTKDLEEFDCNVNELEGIAEYLLNTRGSEVSAVFSERRDNKVKVSLRSNQLDVSKIAVQFGGGGHLNAAGATISGGIEQITAAVISELIQGLSD